MKFELVKAPFGRVEDGREAMLYTITNASGMQISITNYGGIITSILVPDKFGNAGEVVLGYDTLEKYLKDEAYLGAIIGRVANRISDSSFSIEGKNYALAKNDGENHLHGGIKGFDKVLWDAKIEILENEAHIILEYVSPDGEENYPGNLTCKTVFTLFEDNRLTIEYTASCDKPTVINLTHHDYFNLKDGGRSPVLDHELMINAEMYTPTRPDLCVTGEIKHVNDSHFDFRHFQRIGPMIEQKDGGIIPGKGYDQNFVLSHDEDRFGLAAILREESSGRQLIVKSTKECMQFYTASNLSGQLSRDDVPFKPYHGICLECQSFPDAVNKEQFPSIVLNPGEIYKHRTGLWFSVYC